MPKTSINFLEAGDMREPYPAARILRYHHDEQFNTDLTDEETCSRNVPTTCHGETINTKFYEVFEIKRCPSSENDEGKQFIVVQTGGDGESSSITEGLRSALARLRQRSAPGNQTSPLHRPQQNPPQPAKPWEGVKDATTVGSASIGRDNFTFQIGGSENCLVLNVFTKALPSGNSKLKPVMVYIHGGGLTMGSNRPGLYGLEFLMLKYIVLVTINNYYRLGALGFLSVDGNEVTGNMGLKDQTLALKWVQRNIKSFNGDPDNVTIFGESAGGASVHTHVLLPAFKGLFHKAIAQGGCVLNPWFWGSKNNARELVKGLGKTAETELEALEILREVPGLELFNAQEKILNVDDESLAGGSNSPLISSNHHHCPSSPRPKMTVNSQSGPPKSPRPPDDLIATAASALRRLHFKTGRNATKTASSKPQQNQPVPKVIVMGSSTASETTINTSTDSSNTIVTTVTATDGELTEGSLDTAEQIDYFSSENVVDGRCNTVLQPIPATPKTPATARQETPSTCKHETKFTFDDLESSKGESTPKAVAIIHERRFNFDAATPIPMETEPIAPLEEKTVEKFMDEQIEQLKVEARRRNSYKQAAQNYDQLDIESDSKLYSRTKRNSDVGGVMSDSKLHSQRQRENRRSFRRKLDVKDERPERTSPKRRAERGFNSSPENETDSPKPKQRHKKSGRRQPSSGGNNSKARATDKFVYDEKHLANYRTNAAGTSHARMTPPLPDLRVDFFSESLDRRRSSILDSLTTPTVAAALEKRGSVCLNKCLREVGAQLDATNPSATSPINVTTNPLENPVHFGRKAPQATIVVQQASVSLDHANVTSTILLKNGSDFVGNVHALQEPNAAKLAALKSQKEENMKQLLEVANTLTLEEIHDFEMRYGSPHHNRSQSVKTPGRSSGRPNYLCLPQQRSRVASMPNTGVEEEYYRLRHFSITGKGVVNRGDSLKSRRSRSNNSVASSNSSTEQLPGPTSAAGSARTSASCSLASSRESSTSAPGPAPFRVLMLGGPAVGKSSLVSQFMTSEYLHAYDTSIDDESGEKSVSVLLAGEESELTFIDFATMDLSPDSLIKKYNDPHAYAVVYSCADRASFECAEKILQNLWTLDTVGTKAVILVSNKADLVRSRVVPTEEGKSMATAYDCKYIETSVGINHNVDELLVGILSQIRLKLENPERSRDLFRKRSSSKKNLHHRNRSPASGAATPTTGSAQNSPKKYRGSRTSASLKVRSLLGKVWARDSKSKSCENLHVL